MRYFAILLTALTAVILITNLSANAAKKPLKKFQFQRGYITFYDDFTFKAAKDGKTWDGSWRWLDGNIACPIDYKESHCRRFYKISQ